MRVALITGTKRANSIAAGIVPRLEADGWQVCTSDVDSGDYPCDLADASAARDLISRVHADHGTVTGLVLSHAHDVESGVLDTTAESFDRHMAVNARASLLLIAAFAAQLGNARGALIALTSDHTTGNLPYGASKGALDRIVISAARELGPHGVSANVVNPGPIDTGWMDDDMRAALPEHHPLGRLGTPEDIAAVVSFLLSDDGRWMTGQLLHADGGFSARCRVSRQLVDGGGSELGFSHCSCRTRTTVCLTGVVMSRRRPVRDWLERHKRISAHFTTTWTKIADEIRPHANATPVEPVPGRTGRAKDAAQQGRFSR